MTTNCLSGRSCGAPLRSGAIFEDHTCPNHVTQPEKGASQTVATTQRIAAERAGVAADSLEEVARVARQKAVDAEAARKAAESRAAELRAAGLARAAATKK